MDKPNLWERLRGHFQEYIARYSVLALAILTPLAALLGSVAADLGGVNTSTGRAVTAAASAIGVAIVGVTFIRNLGIWQMLDSFGVAPGIHITAAAGSTGGAPLIETGGGSTGETVAQPTEQEVAAMALDPEPGIEEEPEGAVGGKPDVAS